MYLVRSSKFLIKRNSFSIWWARPEAIESQATPELVEFPEKTMSNPEKRNLEITQLLDALRRGEVQSNERLIPILYAELRKPEP